MNIVFLIGVYPNYGGTEKITTVLANRFAADGNRVWIASFEQPRPELAADLNETVQLVSLNYPVKSKANEATLRKLVQDEKIDVIINQWCLPYFVTQLCNRARRDTSCKLISVLHGVPDRSKKVIVAEDSVKAASGLKKVVAEFKLWAVNKVIQGSLRYVYKNSDKYVLLSPSFKASFEKYASMRCTDDKLLAIGNPVTIDIEPCTFECKRKQILYVGRIDKENKRVNRIVEAWEALSRDYPDWSLVLVGDGPHRSELEAYVRNNGIERVSFEGFVKEEPVEYYKKSSILMLTSDLEGFGLVVVDGMSYGVVPVVYGSYSTIYDILDNGVDGFITSYPYNKEETLKALKSLMDDEKQLRRMSEAAKIKSQLFSVDSVYKKWIDLLNS